MDWISVKDQLPPLDTFVLVFRPEINSYGKNSNIIAAYQYQRRLSDEYETEESRNDILRWTTWDKITHWMPLPKPPQESK